MTTYTLLGTKVARDLDDNVIGVTDSTIAVTLPAGTMPNLTYQFDTPSNPVPNPDDEPLPLIEGDVPGATEIDLLDGNLDTLDAYIGFVQFSGAAPSYLLSFTDSPIGMAATDWFFSIGGTPLPDFPGLPDPINRFQNIDAEITNAGPAPSGPFGPGAAIPLAGLANVIATTGEEREIFNAGDDEITTGAGNDGIEVGGGGYDTLRTLAGDDIVYINGERGYTEASVDLGTGRDVLDMADIQDAYVELVHNDGLSAGITAQIDGVLGIGRIDKGAGGSTVLLNPTGAMQGGGLGLHGTAFDDVLTLTGAEDGFVQVRGLGGNDRITVDAGGGIVRLDYRASPDGITADLAAGTVQDGHGGTDTILGRANELRASMHSDNITGSAADDRFILMAGNDTLDGGGGRDTVRYDRSRVDAVTVDLAAGTATGTWRGESFSHSLSNIENVNGARDAGSRIAGNGSSNELRGGSGNDTLEGRGGDDTLIGGAGNDVIDGGSGFDEAAFWGINRADATITQLDGGAVQVVSAAGTDTLTGIEQLGFDDEAVRVNDLFPDPGTVVGGGGADTLTGGDDGETITSGGGGDVVDGGGGDDTIDGGAGNDTLRGGDGADSIDGGEGADTLNGGDGNDSLSGGSSTDDLRDVIYGGSGDDSIDGGAGNDLIFGMSGNDTIAGSAGVDELQGQTGDDVITGSAFSDLVFGGDGNDFVNGGFGHDRINGGTGADKFFHVGVLGHGSDWVQDYAHTEGDVLLFGGPGAASDFQVNFAHTENDAGERSGDDAVREAFVIYKPTGQIMWALVDGEGQSSINLQVGGEVFDLLA